MRNGTILSGTLLQTKEKDNKDIIFHHQCFWEYLGAGSNNTVYKSLCGNYVLKIPKDTDNLMDNPFRAARIFKEINPSLHASPTVLTTGWIYPFIEGSQATPEQQSNYIFNLYKSKGRLLLDGYCEGNILDSCGNMVCVDPANIVKSDSMTSLLCWYQENDLAVKAQVVFKHHWIDTARQYQKNNHCEHARPVFITLGLYFYDIKPAFKIISAEKKKKFLKQDFIFALGVFLYFYYAMKIYRGIILEKNTFKACVQYLMNCDSEELLKEPWDCYTKYDKHDSFFYIKSLSERNLIHVDTVEISKLSNYFLYKKGDEKLTEASSEHSEAASTKQPIATFTNA